METSVMRALLACLVLMMAMDRISDAAWCVCRTDISDTALKKTLDYACGAGADCVPINQNGACYNPNTVNAHCSYAANSYFQRKGQAPQACDFSGTATLIQQDPSSNGCTYPTSPSVAGTSTGNNNGIGTDAAWCVCRTDLSDTTLKKTLDYACGAGADCVPINQNGVCYNPNTVNAHCSYAVNSYFQRKGQAPQTCDFSGTATLIQQDPSSNGCTYPTSPSAAGASTGNNNDTDTSTGIGTNVGTDAAWCVCRTDISDTALQKTLDYACGAGADCVPINQNGACYNPNTVNAHCSYAANSYFQRKGQAPQACDFSGTATLIQQDPSSNGCTYPTSSSSAGASTGNSNSTGAGTGAGTGVDTGVGAGLGSGASPPPPPPTTGNPGSATPSIMTPTNPGTGGVIGSSGNTFSTDNSNDDCIPMPHTVPLLLLILSVLSM